MKNEIAKYWKSSLSRFIREQYNKTSNLPVEYFIDKYVNRKPILKQLGIDKTPPKTEIPIDISEITDKLANTFTNEYANLCREYCDIGIGVRHICENKAPNGKRLSRWLIKKIYEKEKSLTIAEHMKRIADINIRQFTPIANTKFYLSADLNDFLNASYRSWYRSCIAPKECFYATGYIYWHFPGTLIAYVSDTSGIKHGRIFLKLSNNLVYIYREYGNFPYIYVLALINYMIRQTKTKADDWICVKGEVSPYRMTSGVIYDLCYYEKPKFVCVYLRQNLKFKNSDMRVLVQNPVDSSTIHPDTEYIMYYSKETKRKSISVEI